MTFKRGTPKRCYYRHTTSCEERGRGPPLGLSSTVTRQIPAASWDSRADRDAGPAPRGGGAGLVQSTGPSCSPGMCAPRPRRPRQGRHSCAVTPGSCSELAGGPVVGSARGPTCLPPPPAAVTARSACSLLPTRRRLPRPGTGSPASPGPCHHGWTQRGAVQSPAVAPSAAFGPTWPSAWERHGASTRLQLRGHRAAPLLPSQVAGRVVPLGFLTGWGVSDS